jgi:anti-anti-sigma factor
MATQWSDNISVSELSDEPALSEELSSLIQATKAQTGRPSHLVLNFGSVTYMNSSNLGQLLTLNKLRAPLGRSLVLCALCDEIMSAIRVTGLDRVFKVAPDPLTALTMIQIEEEARA